MFLVYYKSATVKDMSRHLARQAGQLISSYHFDAVGRCIILRRRTTEVYRKHDFIIIE